MLKPFWEWEVEAAEGWRLILADGLSEYAAWRKKKDSSWPHGYARLRGKWVQGEFQ